MRVLEETLRLAGPDDDRLVRAAGGEPLAVLAVGHGVHRVLMPLQAVEEVAIGGVVDEHAAADARDELRAVWAVSDVVAHAPHTIALGRRVRPRHHRPHRAPWPPTCASPGALDLADGPTYRKFSFPKV